MHLHKANEPTVCWLGFPKIDVLVAVDAMVWGCSKFSLGGTIWLGVTAVDAAVKVSTFSWKWPKTKRLHVKLLLEQKNSLPWWLMRYLGHT